MFSSGRSQRHNLWDGDPARPRAGRIPAQLMGFVAHYLPWGIALQALAVIHFLRRRPDNIWLFVIIFLGPVGAIVYIAVEVVPDLDLLRHAFDSLGRRKRITHLEALVQQNPSPGNYEELGDLLLEEGKFARARSCYDKALTPRTTTPAVYYRRGIASLEMGDYAEAVRDLETVVSSDSRYDSHRAVALLAQAYAGAGHPTQADAMFQQAVERSTLSETYYNYAAFLMTQGRPVEARQWAEQILAHKATMPRYLQRRERPWFRKAKALLKRLPKG